MNPRNSQKINGNKLIIFFAVLFLVGFVIYAFNLNNRLFWDDDDWIVNNPFVHSFSWYNLKKIFTTDILHGFGLNSNYYRPFLLLTFTFNYVIGGIKPFGYHLLSNLIHIGNAILVFSILYLVLKKRLVAFLTALFFLIHPLQTEAVTYIAGRGDPLSVFFILISLLLFYKSLSRPSIFYFLPSLFSFILAILSRETAIIFPALLMIFYIAFLSKERFLKSIARSFLKSLPYWGISLIYLLLRLTVLNFKNTLNFYSEANVYTQHLSYRLFTFGHALVDYFRLLFVPTGLHMERTIPVHTSLFQWPVWLGFLMVLGVILIGFVLYFKNWGVKNSLKIENWELKIKEPDSFRIWFFGWSWFFIALAPASGIVPINALIYEHWLYLPMVGFWFIVAFYLVKLFDYLNYKLQVTPKESPLLDPTGQANHKQYKNSNDQNTKQGAWNLFGICKLALVIFVIFYLSFFAYQSIQRNILWGKPIQFYEDILRYNPTSIRVLNNLGNLYADSGQLEKAADAYQRAINSPDGSSFPQPYYNLGNIFRDLGQLDKAEEEYKKAIEIDSSFPFAYENLAAIYAKQGDWENAVLMLEKVKKLRPQDPRVYYNLGLIYLVWGKEDLARENLNLALKLSSDNPQASAEIKKILDKLPQN